MNAGMTLPEKGEKAAGRIPTTNQFARIFHRPFPHARMEAAP
jgi:hypothetical protein